MHYRTSCFGLIAPFSIFNSLWYNSNNGHFNLPCNQDFYYYLIIYLPLLYPYTQASGFCFVLLNSWQKMSPTFNTWQLEKHTWHSCRNKKELWLGELTYHLKHKDIQLPLYLISRASSVGALGFFSSITIWLLLQPVINKKEFTYVFCLVWKKKHHHWNHKYIQKQTRRSFYGHIGILYQWSLGKTNIFGLVAYL